MNANWNQQDRIEVAPGETIFRAGDAADGGFLIESGSVEILVGDTGHERRINLIGAGSLLGEMGLLDGQPRSATARAVEATTMVPLYRNHLESVLAQADPLLRHIVTALMSRLRNASRQNLPQAEPPKSAEAAPAVEQVMRALKLAQSLARGITAGELELHYQPIVLLSDRRLVGYEALVRWRHPEFGMVRPDEFIPLAEQTDLIHRIGDFVLNQAALDWDVLGLLCEPPPGGKRFMSVNLSAPEVCRPKICHQVYATLSEHRMAPVDLRIELTETSLVGDKAAVAEVMRKLQSVGISIALDDFGKGFSGMDYLASMPFSCIKIDKSFVDGVLTSERSLQIVRTAIQLAQTLNMSTVGEGIEDEATAQALLDMGCTYGQGYFFGKPMRLADVQAWVARRGAERVAV